MRSNLAVRTQSVATYEGGRAVRQQPLGELTRAVSTCLLFEPSFYESGSDQAERIAALCDACALEDIGALAITARNDLLLRHVPLYLAVQLLRLNSVRRLQSDIPSQVIFEVVQRPDEMGELLALYWKSIGRDPRATGAKKLPAQLKKGLAQAYTRFDEYQLAKWDRDSTVRLRDVLFLVHAKPEDAQQARLWKKLVDGTLETPDTWEVALSAGADKKATWERLLSEHRLGYMALLQNVRNMADAQVDQALVERALLDGAPRSKALPFRFVAAAKAAPSYAQTLSDAMLKALEGRHLDGATLILVDVSGSMRDSLSSRSTLSRMEAAGALAALFREVAPCRVFTFSEQVVEVGAWRGLPLIGGIVQSQAHSSTYLRGALQALKRAGFVAERLVVITDEQSHDGIEPAWISRSYLINVAGYKPALDSSQGWCRISGWSDRVVDWIAHEETGQILQ